MNTRIKKVRLNYEGGKLTQVAFGERIGMTGAGVSKIEAGLTLPSEQTIRAICKEFGVRRQWLETGEEPMYTVDDPDSAETLVPDLVDALNGYPEVLALMRRAAAVMTVEDWERLNDFIRRFVEAGQKDGS